MSDQRWLPLESNPEVTNNFWISPSVNIVISVFLFAGYEQGNNIHWTIFNLKIYSNAYVCSWTVNSKYPFWHCNQFAIYNLGLFSIWTAYFTIILCDLQFLVIKISRCRVFYIYTGNLMKIILNWNLSWFRV